MELLGEDKVKLFCIINNSLMADIKFVRIKNIATKSVYSLDRKFHFTTGTVSPAVYGTLPVPFLIFLTSLPYCYYGTLRDVERSNVQLLAMRCTTINLRYITFSALLTPPFSHFVA